MKPSVKKLLEAILAEMPLRSLLEFNELMRARLNEFKQAGFSIDLEDQISE